MTSSTAPDVTSPPEIWAIGILNITALVQIDNNSSSGIYEAPAFRIPTINIGNRQNGRVKAKSIVDCKPNKEEIVKAIKMVQSNSFTKKLKNMKIPFEGGKTAEKNIRENSSGG